jgi:hypothetical protein
MTSRSRAQSSQASVGLSDSITRAWPRRLPTAASSRTLRRGTPSERPIAGAWEVPVPAPVEETRVPERMVGVVWERRGLCAVPTMRWMSLDDLDLVCSGIAPKTLIAVSNYGSRRDPELRSIFDRGLPALAERLDPAAMLVFGDTRSRVFDTLRKSRASWSTSLRLLPP